MFLFCRGYSDIPFGDVSSFEDKGENITPAQVRGVIGIERTDFFRRKKSITVSANHEFIILPAIMKKDTPYRFSI